MTVPGEAAAMAERREVARVVLRPIGHSLPLGFVGLVVATTLLSGLQLGWYPATEGKTVAVILVGFVFPVQLVSSIFGYLGRDAVAGTAMGILAGTWLSLGLVQHGAPPGTTSKSLGTFLVVAGAAMLIPALGASMTKLVPALVLATTAARLVVTGLYQVFGTSGWKTAAGTVGLVLAVLAFYAALAIEAADVTGREPLPILRRGRGRQATQGSLDDQLTDIEHAPGVRREL